MAADGRFAFGSFRFDARTGQLWRDGSELKLTPRAASVLQALAERAPEVVTKQDLLDRVWGGMAVGDDALTSCVQELRGALGDDARRPHIIETRHRRGYRLMVAVETVAEGAAAAQRRRPIALESSRLVGRTAELAELARAFDQASAGNRQVIFVTGEPGIGKSALADTFVTQLAESHGANVAFGQCLDHHGAGEAYLPLIDALTRLAGAAGGQPMKEILARRAPSWLAQMPSLWTASERRALEARARPTRERMMRELTDAIEAIAADTPLVLRTRRHSLERRFDARLDRARGAPPRGRAAARAGDIPAGGCCGSDSRTRPPCERTRAARVMSGNRAQSPRPAGPSKLSGRTIERRRRYPTAPGGDAHSLERTGGNPLFMTSIVHQLAQSTAAIPTLAAIGSIPHDVRRFIDRQVDELAEADRELLTAASVIGRKFAAAAVAAALKSEVEEIEVVCARLARQGIFIGQVRDRHACLEHCLAGRHPLEILHLPA